MEINLPHHFDPRPYQLPIMQAMEQGYRRAVWVAHRRSGKDKTAFNILVPKTQERVGTYYYFFPSYAQGRKVIWDGADRDGFRFISHIPKQLIESKNDSEMKIRLKNGSLIQLVGTDNYDSIMGTNPVGCVFSEYSIQDPKAWDFIRPILRENDGWALFIYTPRGKNHGYELFEMAKENPEWFAEKLTVEDTGVLSPEDIDAERREGMDEELIQQEYYCSFESSLQGAYYASQLKEAAADGRITSVPYDRRVPVDTWWDLGIGDSTTIWFTQSIGQEVRFIDYYENQGEGLQHYAQYLRDLDYVYGTHNMPHDIDVKELGTGQSRKEIAESLGIRPLRVVPKLPIEDGINAARMIFNRCWFDEKKCAVGINALHNYVKEWDEKRQEFKRKPLHNWASHAADSFRYFAVGHRPRGGTQVIRHGF